MSTTVLPPIPATDDRPMMHRYQIERWQRWAAFRRRYRWELKNGRRS